MDNINLIYFIFCAEIIIFVCQLTKIAVINKQTIKSKELEYRIAKFKFKCICFKIIASICSRPTFLYDFTGFILIWPTYVYKKKVRIDEACFFQNKFY